MTVFVGGVLVVIHVLSGCANLKGPSISPEAARLLQEGVRLAVAHQYEKSVDSFSKALELSPQYKEAWIQKGKSLNGSRRFKEAITCEFRSIRVGAAYL
ncbi:MAG: tetratricopeptide repeat protein [Elusimicrobia bacterium]|nr:tetratricopeptide repeat protein [Elusimicrobiota bacterium]